MSCLRPSKFTCSLFINTFVRQLNPAPLPIEIEVLMHILYFSETFKLYNIFWRDTVPQWKYCVPFLDHFVMLVEEC